MSTPGAQTKYAREDLGAKIAQRRKRLGMSNQEQLAAAAGVSTKSISNVESGSKIVRLQTMRKIEFALGWKPGSTDAILAGGQPTELDTQETDEPDLRDEWERQIWGIKGLSEEERWLAIDILRARRARRRATDERRTG